MDQTLLTIVFVQTGNRSHRGHVLNDAHLRQLGISHPFCILHPDAQGASPLARFWPSQVEIDNSF